VQLFSHNLRICVFGLINVLCLRPYKHRIHNYGLIGSIQDEMQKSNSNSNSNSTRAGTNSYLHGNLCAEFVGSGDA